MSTLYYESSIAHHGVKGQRWGVRRYQNPDGSLTKAGKRHERKQHYEGGKLHERFIQKLDQHGSNLAKTGATPTRITTRYIKEALPVHIGALLGVAASSALATPVSGIAAATIGIGNVVYQAYKGAKYGYDFGSYKTHVSEDRQKHEMQK